MKFSRFNVWTLVQSKLVIYNTLTGALASFDPDDKVTVLEALENNATLNIPDEFVTDMTEDGYLVDDQRDELDAIRSAISDRHSRTDEYSLCITLNKRCNFSCTYCFQLHDGRSLPVLESRKIIRLFRNILPKAKKIEVDWFGGEPLLSFPKLKEMNDRFFRLAEKAGVRYAFSITTNGYLLTGNILEYLEERRPVQLVVTLDGPPEVHDKSRPLKNGRGTFGVILENIKQMVAKGLNVTLRVNVSRVNVDQIPELFEILETHRLKNKLRINLQPIVSSTANPCEECCLSGYDSAHSILSIYLCQIKKGWTTFPLRENLQVLGFCIGEYPNRIVIDLHGNVHRCTQMADGDSVGTISVLGQVELDVTKLSEWEEKNPLSFPRCRDCSILPICMGGCNMRRLLDDGTDYCLEWKHDIQTLLEVLVAYEETEES